jgi:hypothetical protein
MYRAVASLDGLEKQVRQPLRSCMFYGSMILLNISQFPCSRDCCIATLGMTVSRCSNHGQQLLLLSHILQWCLMEF